MSNIQPVVFAADLATLGRGFDTVARGSRAASLGPAVSPPAVILPRAAAWLNPPPSTPSESAAAAETPVAQTDGSQGSGQPAAPTGSGQAGSFASGSPADIYSQAAAVQAAAPAAASAQATPGIGSLVQFV